MGSMTPQPSVFTYTQNTHTTRIWAGSVSNLHWPIRSRSIDFEVFGSSYVSLKKQRSFLYAM